MSGALKITGVLVVAALSLTIAASADTQNPPQHRVHKAAKKQELPAPLPSGPQGPVPQVPLDAIPAVAPQVSYQNGLLTIVAPNSTLADILRSVHKHTSAEIDVPNSASERVVTRLGPAPAREVMAELLNGSRFNYILLGSAEDANSLVRVVLVPKTSEASAAQSANNAAATSDSSAYAEEPEAQDDNNTPDDSQDQNAEAEPAEQPEQPAVKTPQQMLQEMQQRQLQMQQGQQQPGTPPAPYFPGRPGVPQQQQQQENQ